MSFNELDLQRINKAAAVFMAQHRPPLHVRAQLDYEYQISGQSVELLEVRPQWNCPSEIMKRSVAKATYVRTLNLWTVYWMRGNLAWRAVRASWFQSVPLSPGFFKVLA